MTSRVLPRLYLVTNRHQTRERPLQSVIQETLLAGTRFIQLREKDLDTRQLFSLAQDIRIESHQHQALMLINDRVDIAKAIGADGVHLRTESLPVQQARQILGPQALIGKSTHSLREALTAEADEADFLVCGPIFETPSKRTYGPPLGLTVLTDICKQCTLPVFAIGGMTPERIQDVRDCGAYGVALISAILESTTISTATQKFLQALEIS